MRSLLTALLLVASSLVASPALAQSAPGGRAAHRMVFAPTARAIPSGEWQLGLMQVVIPNASAGLGRGVSLGAGMTVGLPRPVSAGVAFIEPKVTIVDRPGLDVALGATAQIFPTGDRRAFVLPYAVATLGAAETPGTFAATFGLAGRLNVRPSGGRTHAVYVVRAPAVFAGTELRVSSQVTVLLEAVAVPDQSVWPDNVLSGCDRCSSSALGGAPRGSVTYDATLSTVVRYATDHAAIDAGMALIHDSDFYNLFFAPVPLLNMTFDVGSD